MNGVAWNLNQECGNINVYRDCVCNKMKQNKKLYSGQCVRLFTHLFKMCKMPSNVDIKPFQGFTSRVNINTVCKCWRVLERLLKTFENVPKVVVWNSFYCDCFDWKKRWYYHVLYLKVFVFEMMIETESIKMKMSTPTQRGNAPSDYVGFGSESYMMWFLDSVLTLNGFTQNLYKRTQKGHRKRGFLSHIRVGKWNPYMKKKGMIEHGKIRKEVGKEKG